MLPTLHQLLLVARTYWRQHLLELSFVLLPATAIVALVLILSLPISHSPTTAFLLALFISFLLIYKRRAGIAFFVSLAAGFIIDFFLIKPLFSFYVSRLEEALELLFFLLLVMVFGSLYSHAQRQADKAIQDEHSMSALYEEQLHRHEEEASQREGELRIYFHVVREIHKEKDLKQALTSIAQAIDSAFSTCGIRGCVFLMPNFEGSSLQSMIATQSPHAGNLSRDEERSAEWVINSCQSMRLPLTSSGFQADGRYVRWPVSRRFLEETATSGFSYIAPIVSRGKVIGAIRLLVDDIMHPRFLAIKRSLEEHNCAATGEQADAFLEFLDHASALIEEALIERALRKQKEEEIEVGQRIEEFYKSITSHVSHDLKTPLTVIKGAASSLMDHDDMWSDETERRSVLGEIIRNVNRLELYITRMLDVSRIEQGKLRLNTERYPIETLVRDTLDYKHLQALLKDRPVDSEGLEKLPDVEMDPILIGQVLGNLLENAARYTPEGTPIEIKGRVEGKRVVLSVTDHGPGIPPEEKERIFEKFHRITRKIEKGERTVAVNGSFVPADQGTGLGLAVCRGYIEAHHGRIWAENHDGGGARFQFTLPLRQKRDST